MKDRVLTIEQMQELVALGADTSTASMCWYPMTLSYKTMEEIIFKAFFSNYFPT